jgi:alpha-ribazole phosphatase
MVTTLYLIRHGETEGDGIRRYKGTLDVPLSEKGIKQVERVSKHILKLISTIQKEGDTMPVTGPKLAAVYSSDLSRALKSAEIIARPHSLRPIAVSSLSERNFGVWEGMSFEEIKEKYPEEFKAWGENPLEFSPVKGESTLEVRDRVMDAFERIVQAHPGERVAIVAHGGVNRIILCHILGIPLENIFRVEQDFAALNIIEFWDGYPVVKLMNGTIQD